ncbi:DUF3048 domain-containing protein [Paenibacillus eucommiae]|uniref:DUF3048 domain-containing protein n=1 Tax=Paenibacillus eucommiae TaxID=1355755 RepID=A0ABS4J7K5_9BACL|nr:DUF3048 domain-containing protein [Paenibacillus eucommiae]MBP1995803.1 hypothetical protein [Paenibacillus eucommiae]
MKLLKAYRKQTISVLLLLGLTGTVITGCGGGTLKAIPTPGPVETSTPIPTTAPSPTPVPAPYSFPFTGMPSQEEVKSRPFIVMVENSPQARPQTGLDQADIVYEILAEGEITRFVAVYQSQDAKVIGPVRSIRPYFVEIGAGLDAVIVHAGWSQDAMNILVGRKLAHLDQVYGDDAFYWRDKDRKAPHNLYTSVEKMKLGAETRKFREEWKGPVLSFAKDGKSTFQTSSAATSATKIEIPYISGYVVSYEYDVESGQYKRTMAGKPHLDKESEKQLTATNLLVLESKHQILDNAGRRNVDIFGPGKGIMLQQGKQIEVTWEQKNGIIRAYDGANEVRLLPGTTWVQIVPINSAVKVE